MITCESDWLASTNPAEMLAYLCPGNRHGTSGQLVSDRRLRLFACACCRLHDRADQWDIDAYETDGFTFEGESMPDEAWAKGWTEIGLNKPTIAVRAAILRDIVGNPFAENVVALPCPRCDRKRHCLCEWLTPTVVHLAQAIYDERAWDRMPVLADALEESGCDNADVLGHCRGTELCHQCGGGVFLPPVVKTGNGTLTCTPCGGKGRIGMRGPHVRGCWVLSLILGQE